jgi:hypothetical protein
MAIERIPPARAGDADEGPFRNYGNGGLGVDAQRKMIGGSYHVSTPIDPEMALTGGYQAIAGDTMPAGAPVDGNPPYTGPYLPKN